jgi:hypothetical protein
MPAFGLDQYNRDFILKRIPILSHLQWVNKDLAIYLKYSQEVIDEKVCYNSPTGMSHQITTLVISRNWWLIL